jgi:glutamate--cysteine ligase
MLVRRTLDDYEPVLRPFPFSAWIEHGHPAGFPTVDDLDYHLTTLFPPVRPRGWLEVRYLDALPDPWWQAAGIVVSTLLIDAAAGAAAAKAAAGTKSLWPEAARCGLGHPRLAVAAQGCFEAALAAADDPDGIAAAYFDRYVARGRTPADDMLATAWH